MCPYCNKDITELGVIVRATQLLSPVTGYSSIEEIEETLGYYCPECGKTLDEEFGKELADAFIDTYEGGE